jgi:hypothetical protein
MFLFPLFRFNNSSEPGISLIAQGPEVVGNPNIDVHLTKSDGTVVVLNVAAKKVKGDVMFIHAVPSSPIPTPTAAVTDDGGVGSITVTVTGTSDGITAQVGYGDPSTGIPTSGPPGKPPA